MYPPALGRQSRTVLVRMSADSHDQIRRRNHLISNNRRKLLTYIDSHFPHYGNGAGVQAVRLKPR